MTGPNLPPGNPRQRRGARRAADAPPVLVVLDATDGRPLHQQIYDELRTAIVEHRLGAGARVPSTRALAGDLEVARNTVALAYEQLRIEGYIVGRRGGGTRVASTIPDRVLHVRTFGRSRSGGSRAGSSGGKAAAPNGAGPRAATLSARGKLLAESGRSMVADGRAPTPFRLGLPALETFPTSLWTRLAARHWRREQVSLGASDPAGEPALRQAIAEYVVNARGARCEPDQVFVLNGAQQALDLSARMLLDPDDRVWIEDPGYHAARAALTAAGARLVPVPVDGEGLDVAEGTRRAPAARLAYVTPSHQFPLGVVMSAPRRMKLLDWARAAGAWILEDDYDSEFRYAGRPLPCLQGLDAQSGEGDASARVLYVGTFNKALVPGLRLGYLLVPAPLVDTFRAARAVVDRHSSTFAQGVLADFIGEGHYARHLRRLRAVYAERQQAVIETARTELGDALTFDADPAGLHLVGWLPSGLSDAAVADAAREQGVVVYPLSRFHHAPDTGTARAGLVLGYAPFDERAIRAAIRRLARALRRR